MHSFPRPIAALPAQHERAPEPEPSALIWGSGPGPPRINHALPGWKEEKAAIERMWALYLETVPSVKEEAEQWKGDADGIIIFTGLFSAMVAAFVIESYKYLSPDPSNATTLILAQISQQLASVDGSTPVSTQLLNGISTSTGASSVRVNVLLVLSLCISVTCALFAVMVQQWARRFQRICDRRSQGSQSSQALARVRLHLAPMGLQVQNFISMLQRSLHIAVILFFAGLIEFFWPIDISVGRTVLAMLVILGAMYLSLTVYSFTEPTSLFQTPLTQNVFEVFALTSNTIYSVFSGHGARSVLEALRRMFLPLGPLTVEKFNSSRHFLVALSRHGHLGFDEAMTLAINEGPLGSLEIDALVWLFQAYRAGSPEQLFRGAGICFVGLCTILGMYLPSKGQGVPIAPEALDLITKLYQSPAPDAWTQYFDSWESWLVHVTRTCDLSTPASVHFTVMCFRMHWFVLHGTSIVLPPISNTLVNSGSQYATNDRPNFALYNTLQTLREHFSVTVAIVARCLQARIAAALDARWAIPGPGVSDHNSDLFWNFISVPRTLAQNARADPAVYAATCNRAILIVIALVQDTLDAGRLRSVSGSTRLPPLRRGAGPVLKTIDTLQACIFERTANPPLLMLIDALETYYLETRVSLLPTRDEGPAYENERALLAALEGILWRLGRPEKAEADNPTTTPREGSGHTTPHEYLPSLRRGEDMDIDKEDV
ncbi:unnamed protein product [Peniophora sp. CBMAI 1063]|nr:unnamed protein product [Peniophora sp. CBMAI 1063]